MKSMKWINRLIPTNGSIIEKVDLNCVKFSKCEAEPQRLLYIYIWTIISISTYICIKCSEKY